MRPTLRARRVFSYPHQDGAPPWERPSPEHKPSSEPSNTRASRSRSAYPAERSSPPTTRCSGVPFVTSSPGTSKGPATWPPDTPMPPVALGSPWRLPDRAPRISSRRSKTPTWTRFRWWRSPVRLPALRLDSTRSRKPTPGASRCRRPNTTTSSPTSTRSPTSSGRPFTWRQPGGPARCSSTFPRTSSLRR